MPGLGHRSYMQFGKETIYGTPVAATGLKLEVISMNVAPVIGVIQDPSLTAAPSRRGIYQAGLLFKGTIVLRANYDGMEELLRGVLGTYTGPALVDMARDHTFKESSTLNSYTVELIEGDVPTTKAFRLSGAKFTGITIRGTAGQGTDAMVQIEVTVLAKDKTSNFTPTGALAFPNLFPVLYHQAITIDDGTADAATAVRVRSFEVTLEQPHTEDRFYLGAVNVDEPLRADFLVARFRFTQEFTTQTQFDAARSFTVGSPQLIFQHPTLIGSTSKREFEVRANKANLVEFSAPVEGYGVILSTATWEAWYDTGDTSAMVVRTKNALSALV